MMQQWSRGTKYSISSYDSRWFEQIWCILEVLIFSPLTYNGEVTKLTWPKVTDIKNSKYTNCRHLCPYCAMRVSNSLDHWCAFGNMSNFEKRSLRSGHLMRPGHMTFGVIGSPFFRKCVKLLTEWLWQIWRRYAPPFFSLSAKNRTGAEINPPPPVLGLKIPSQEIITCHVIKRLLIIKLSSYISPRYKSKNGWCSFLPCRLIMARSWTLDKRRTMMSESFDARAQVCRYIVQVWLRN